MFTTFRYVIKERRGSLWARRDVIKEIMDSPGWVVGISRIDLWVVLPESVHPAASITVQGNWTESESETRESQ